MKVILISNKEGIKNKEEEFSELAISSYICAAQLCGRIKDIIPEGNGLLVSIDGGFSVGMTKKDYQKVLHMIEINKHSSLFHEYIDLQIQHNTSF